MNKSENGYKETKEHGSAMMPFTIYGTQIPRIFRFFPAHWHEDYEIICAMHGECIYNVNFKEYHIKKGDILIIPPAAIHSFRQFENSAFFGFTILFKLSYINNTVDVCSAKYFIPLINNEVTLPVLVNDNNKYYKNFESILSELIHSFMEEKPGYELDIKIYLLKLFKEFFIDSMVTENKSDEIVNRKVTDRIKQSLNYIEEHYNEKITLEMLAKETGFSTYRFAHVFKECTNMSPVEYINRYRLVTAADMLVKSDDPIINIANDTGYGSISYFNRAFKNSFHVTPGEYRLRNRQQEITVKK